jgi:hypothetical protein
MRQGVYSTDLKLLSAIILYVNSVDRRERNSEKVHGRTNNMAKKYRLLLLSLFDVPCGNVIGPNARSLRIRAHILLLLVITRVEF